MVDATRRSPLGHLSGRLAAASEAPETIRLAEIAFATQLTLRAAPETPAAYAAAAALGIGGLPGPGTAARAGNLHVLGLGPDECLVVADDGERAGLAERLGAAVAGEHATVVDVSAQRAVVEVAGAAARDVLCKGCSLDLHPRAFAAGRCAATALARAAVILHQVDDEPRYRLFAQASFAEYVAQWLLDASAEYRRVAPLTLRRAAG